jgi:hypothetical protein
MRKIVAGLHMSLDGVVESPDTWVVGSGKRLFEDGGPPVPLKLVEEQTFSTGVLSLSYEQAGR